MIKISKSIPVTKTYLPPLNDYIKYLKKIWDSGWITNNGTYVIELEKKLKKHLGVKYISYVNNGTTALQIALKSLNIHGEVITTPFTYIATVSSIIWEHCTPVFADIDIETLCIDPQKIKALITTKTKAIFAVHVYGNPCDVETIDQLAKKNNIKVIYDAAHAFGVTYKGNSILNYGDISTLSFHATKIFHTAEGGAIITRDKSLAHIVSYMKNFGHKGYDTDFFGLGVNGKNTEMHAILGLCMLSRMQVLIDKRRRLSELYDKLLSPKKLKRPRIHPKINYNYSYYPVIFETEAKLLEVKRHLNRHNILPRRYFYPSLNIIPYIINHSFKQSVPIAEDISKRVLCLPLHSYLKKTDVKKIAQLILEKL